MWSCWQPRGVWWLVMLSSYLAMLSWTKGCWQVINTDKMFTAVPCVFKCLSGLAPAYLVAFCTKGSAVSGRSALRSAVRGDLVVPSHRTDWGLRAVAVAGSSCWNELPVDLRDLTVGPATFAKHLKKHLFRVGFFWWSTHFWVCVTFCRVRYQVQ